MRDGKSMIVEGSHLDPGLFLYEFGRYGVHHMQQRLVQASLHAPNPVGRSHMSPLDDLSQPKHKRWGCSLLCTMHSRRTCLHQRADDSAMRTDSAFYDLLDGMRKRL